MNSAPSCSKATISPPRKRKSMHVGHLSVAEKLQVINLYKSIKHDNPDMTARKTAKQIAENLGIAESTVYRTLKDYRERGEISDPKKAAGRPSLLITEGDKTSIRQIIHSFFYDNELPTLDKILNRMKDRDDLPNMSRSTLHKTMKQINFKFLKRQRRSILVERDDISRWRYRYLTSIRSYREQGRPIYYLDETWLNEGHTKAKVWVDENVTSKRQAFIEGLTIGAKNPTGKGRRLIVLHIGSEDGFLEDSLLLFEGKKTTDYHEEMNATVFEEWFERILQKLPDNAVIVMDNASYHSRRLEKIPTSSSRKTDMQEWLRSKNITFEENWPRSELLYLIQNNRDQYNLMVTDEMAKAQNKALLRLPPYYCELNPIELIWAQIKGEVAPRNKTFKLNEVQKLLLEAIHNVTSENWKNCISHVIKEEAKMWKLDGLMDNVIEPLIISLGNDSSDTSEDDSDLSD